MAGKTARRLWNVLFRSGWILVVLADILHRMDNYGAIIIHSANNILLSYYR